MEARDEKAVGPILVRREPQASATDGSCGQRRAIGTPTRMAIEKVARLIGAFLIQQRASHENEPSAGLDQHCGKIQQARL